MGAGAVAGGLGSLLGIGGGVFLVPFLNAALGIPFKTASGISLMTVIGTSSAVSAGATGRGLINLRLGMLLQVAAGAGGFIGVHTVVLLPQRAIQGIFAAVAAAVAIIMLTRLERRNVILDSAVDPGRLGGRFYEEESGREVVYRVKRLPLAIALSLVAGFVSGLLGIGGGVLQVPAMNAWCGVPLRAAAATSAVMIGVTAMASAPIAYMRGDVLPAAAAAAVIGVLIGSRIGLRFGDRASAKSLKLLMAIVLAAVALTYLAKAL